MAKIRRGFIEDYFHGINMEIILFDKDIKFNDKSRHYLNPIDGDKSVTFYGKGFKDGDMFYITNYNPEHTLYQTNTDITIMPGQMYLFFYTSERSIKDGLPFVDDLKWYSVLTIG